MRQDKEFSLPAGAEVSIIPVMQGEGLLKFDESELPDILPVLALRNAVLFPGAVFPITIGREKSVRLIQDAEKESFFIGAVPQNDVMVDEPQEEDLCRYGSVCKVLKTLEMPDGTITAILQAFKRLSLDAVLGYEPYITARVHYLPDILPDDSRSTDIKAIADSLKDKAINILRASNIGTRETIGALKAIDDFKFLVNFIATTIEVENFESKIRLLEYDDVKVRALKLLAVLDS
ncbi:MAG: LON peptidase substrate-binding domain-containing protein, partial [Bacteroidales bacterium]|nr:LON peptidase substrate-binding domain-containing protein [Bacteroidales bacterium]